MSQMLFQVKGVNRRHGRKLKRGSLSRTVFIPVWAWVLMGGMAIYAVSVDTPDLSGIWTSGKNSIIEINQEGIKVRAVNKEVPIESKKTYGFKEGDEHFTGTLDDRVLRARMETHYPLSFKPNCPNSWKKRVLLILSVEDDNNILRGSWRQYRMSPETCEERYEKTVSIEYVRLTKGELPIQKGFRR